MRRVHIALRWVGYALAALIGWAAIVAFPDLQNWAIGAAVAVFAYRIIDQLVETVVRRVLDKELGEIRRQFYTDSERIEVIDRKVGAIWDRIRQIQ